MRRRWWIVLGLAAVAAGLGWFVLDRDEEAVQPRRSKGLDVPAFRAELARRIQQAKRIADRRSGRHRDAARTPGLIRLMGMVEPQCTLGPRELCTSLAPLISSCDDGDALDCIAVGEFVLDTPPRSQFGLAFFGKACRLGDPAACRRVDELKSDFSGPCESEPLACAMTALRAKDRARLDESCALGVAASCAFMSFLTEDNLALSRAYIEMGCQFGDPAMCQGLSRQLRPDCLPDERTTCFEPDPELARKALEIACAAGWEDPSVCDASLTTPSP